MDISVPTDWRQVDEADFREYLSRCPEYTRDLFNHMVYTFKWNKKRFAIDAGKGEIFIDPSILEPVNQQMGPA